MHVDEWKAFFNEVRYTGDYYWFIPSISIIQHSINGEFDEEKAYRCNRITAADEENTYDGRDNSTALF